MKKIFYIISFFLVLILIPLLLFIAQHQFLIFNSLLQKQGYVLSNISQRHNELFIERNIENVWRFFNQIDVKEEDKLILIEQNDSAKIVHKVHYKDEKFDYTKITFENRQITKETQACVGFSKTPYYSKGQNQIDFALYCENKEAYSSRHTVPNSHTLFFNFSKGYIFEIDDKRHLLKENK